MKTSLLIILVIVNVFLLTHSDQSYAITNLIDEAKEKGLPYITSLQVEHDVLKSDDSSLLVLQVDFHSKNNTDIWIDIKPVIENQFISYHKAGFSIASGISEPYGGQVKNQHKIQDYVQYDDSVIRLHSNESKQIPVTVKVPEEYLEKFQNEPLPIMVGFELIDSNLLEKIPRDLEKLEIKSESSVNTPPIHPDDLKKCLDGEFLQYEWCKNYISLQSPLKQIKSGIKFHNVECKDGLELTYKKSDDTSVCVALTTKIELVVRGWAEDDRLLLGCTSARHDKCYPPNPLEYRKALYDYYFDDSNLPSSESFDFASLSTINACSEQSVCFANLDNGTKMRVSCDYPTHGCTPIVFDEYEVAD